MTVGEIIEQVSLTVMAATAGLDKEVKQGYVSDLLSNVMAFAGADSVWVTMQGHQNIVAVASLAGLSAVIIAGGAKPEDETIAKAKQEGVALLTTPLPSFEVAGQLYRLGIRGA